MVDQLLQTPEWSYPSVLALGCVAFVERAKLASRLSWISIETNRLNLLLSVSLAVVLASLFHAGELYDGTLELSHLGVDFVKQYGLQEVIYRIGWKTVLQGFIRKATLTEKTDQTLDEK